MVLASETSDSMIDDDVIRGTSTTTLGLCLFAKEFTRFVRVWIFHDSLTCREGFIPYNRSRATAYNSIRIAHENARNRFVTINQNKFIEHAIDYTCYLIKKLLTRLLIKRLNFDLKNLLGSHPSRWGSWFDYHLLTTTSKRLRLIHSTWSIQECGEKIRIIQLFEATLTSHTSRGREQKKQKHLSWC